MVLAMQPIAAIAGTILLLAASAPAQSAVTGRDLLERCSAAADSTWCDGYIDAVFDLLKEGIAFSIGPVRVCPAATVTPRDLRAVVIDYLRANATVRDASASLLVSVALAEAFPCAGGN